MVCDQVPWLLRIALVVVVFLGIGALVNLAQVDMHFLWSPEEKLVRFLHDHQSQTGMYHWGPAVAAFGRD